MRMIMELDSETVTLTGNVLTDIDIVCDDLRRRMREAAEQMRADVLEYSPEYTMLSFVQGRQDSALVWLNMVAGRPETSEEIKARLEKERKAEIRKQKTVLAARERDLKTIRDLAVKHNLPLQINQEVLAGAVEAVDE